jgi:hypothetical protein
MTTPTLHEAAQAAPKSDDLPDYVCKALRRAWQLGQTYWQQADSESYAANRRSETTQAKFSNLLEEVRTALAAQSAPSEPKVTVTTNQAGDAVAVTLTDDDNRVLRVLWDRAAQQAAPAQARQPLPEQDANALWVSATIERTDMRSVYLRGLRDGEAAHGITAAKKGE